MTKKVVEHKVIKTCGNIGLQEALIQVVDLVKEGYDVDRDWRSIYNSTNRNLTYTVHMIKEEDVEDESSVDAPSVGEQLIEAVQQIEDGDIGNVTEIQKEETQEEKVVPEYVNEHKTASDYLEELEGITKKNDLLKLAKEVDVNVPKGIKSPLGIKKHIKEELEKRS